MRIGLTENDASLNMEDMSISSDDNQMDYEFSSYKKENV